MLIGSTSIATVTPFHFRGRSTASTASAASPCRAAREGLTSLYTDTITVDARFPSVHPVRSRRRHAAPQHRRRCHLAGVAGGGPVPGGVIQSFRIDPRNAGTIYILLGGSIYRKVGTGPWESHVELPNGQALFPTVDPTTSALYAGGAAGLFKSVNSGVTWTPTGPGISGTVIATVVDPFDASHLFA
jgi:hypothetical protein